MANLSRFDPFGDMLSLREAMNQLVEESFVNPTRSPSAGSANMPLNVSETPEAYIVEAAVPGVKPDDLDITLQDNVLTLTAETRQEQTKQQENFHRVERRYGRVTRTLGLPARTKADAIQATLENGLLRLEIPKAEEVKPRKITINASGSQQPQTIDVSPEGEQQSSNQ